MRVEVLVDRQMVSRGDRILRAMIEAAPIPVRVSETYVGDCEILMAYGLGHPGRRPAWEGHQKAGGRCIGWDLGYWRRKEGTNIRMRATLDDDHPHRWIRPEPGERWDRDGISLREVANTKSGHIILVGLTHKANVMNGDLPLAWERRQWKRLQQIYPGRQIIFRPKRAGDFRPPGVPYRLGPIEDLLVGASLVVCRHSNVAIDACIAGVPVVCEDGAALALYDSNLAAPINPSRAERLAFLRSLAWWNWKPEEAADAWTYLISRIRCA